MSKELKNFLADEFTEAEIELILAEDLIAEVLAEDITAYVMSERPEAVAEEVMQAAFVLLQGAQTPEEIALELVERVVLNKALNAGKPADNRGTLTSRNRKRPLSQTTRYQTARKFKRRAKLIAKSS